MKTRPDSIVEALELHARQNPERPCIGDKKKMLSYGEMLHLVRKGAGYLLSRDVKKGDIVTIRASQTADCIASVFAAQYIGAVPCVLEKNASRERITEIMRELGVRWYLNDRADAPDDSVFLDARLFHEEAYPECPLDAADYADGTDIAEIIYTTGTTGKSKGIMISRAADIAIAENVIDSVSMCLNEVEIITTPVSHALGIRRVYGAVFNGSAAVLADKFVFAESFFKLADRYRVNAATFSPSGIKALLEQTRDRLAAYDQILHYIELGSAPLHESLKKELMELLPHVRLYNIYGTTESGCTITLEFSKYPDKRNCIGRTTVNTELLFVNEQGEPVNAHDEESAGYMAFLGGMNMSGYVNDHEATAEALRNGVVYTNDLGYRDENGFVYFLGRRGDVITSGGLKINPLEVEEAAQRCPGVADCACIARPDTLLGDVPFLLIVPETETTVSEEELIIHLSRYLEPYKVPHGIKEVKEIPRTFNGKIIRRQLEGAWK